MDNYTAATYGDRVADVYDVWHAELDSTDTVELLASLAGAGPVLELAVGTGRVALPLAERGLQVHGLDSSQAMVDRLRAKPGGDEIEVTIGDMADVPVAGPFTLAFVVFNSFFALLTQDDQVRCFEKVAAKLSPGGRFVIECFFPDLNLYQRGQRIAPVSLDLDAVRLNVAVHQRAEQRIEGQQILITPEGTHFSPVRLRYAWPAELDLMARLAGLRLQDRWSGWRREPFGDDSGYHVSVYEKPAAP